MAHTDTEETTEEKHEVTGVEAAWVQAKHSPLILEDGETITVDYIQNSTEIMRSIDSLTAESKWDCSCGTQLASWQEVEQHFREVGQDATNAVQMDDTHQKQATTETVEVEKDTLRTFLTWAHGDSATDVAPDKVTAADEELWSALDGDDSEAA